MAASPFENTEKRNAAWEQELQDTKVDMEGKGSGKRRRRPVGHGLTPHFIREHPAFKRNKLTLLTMGIAVVLVANVTFLGFLTPPKAPEVPLLVFDLPSNKMIDGSPDNGFINFVLSKTYKKFPNGTLDVDNPDYSNFSVADYAALYSSVDQTKFCPYHIATAFNILNGFAFAFAVATLFLVAIVPVFIRRNHWDSYLAKTGAICMSITLIFFVVAFVLAGFVTAGVGMPSSSQCDYVTSQDQLVKAIETGRAPDDEAQIQSASAYATLGMVCLLIVIVAFLSLKETKMVGRDDEMSSIADRQDDSMQSELS